MEESKVMIWQWIADGRMNNGKLQIDRQINKGITLKQQKHKSHKKTKSVNDFVIWSKVKSLNL
jgi:hypothetical protein